MVDYKQFINMMTQVMMVGMMGSVVRASPLMLQEKKPTVKELTERILALESRVSALEGKPAKKPLFGGRSTAVPIIDTSTKRVYHSKFTCGKALCAEVGTNPGDKFAWYKLTAKFPDRFRAATEAEIARSKTAGTYLQMEPL